jgi:diguanylate cyclase (GGDEF)-like protein
MVKVLTAEDDRVSQLSLRRALEAWGYQVVPACNGAEAWRILQAPDAPFLAIINWVMPGMDGIDICRQLRANVDMPYRYIIMLSAKREKNDIVKAMQAGADDFVSKPFHLEELRVRLRAGQRILDLQEKLRIKGSHDALTGLFNRRMILDALAREVARATRDTTPIAVMLVELDRFKDVNDRFGRQLGDEALREVASRIKAALRTVDIAGRYSGREFLIVLPRCDTEASHQVAERVRDAIAKDPILWSKQSIKVTSSIGVATACSGHVLRPDVLIRNADAALDRAKDAHENRAAAAG